MQRDANDRDTASRAEMVRDQIERRGVVDPAVLRAMQAVPRHLFVPPEQRASAYADRALPIGEGQTISQPYMVAAMTEALRVGPESRVLEIGTGTGYQTAILASIAKAVISVERRLTLAERARELLATLGFANVRVVVGDGSEGHAAEAPYDGILVTAGAPRVPAPLLDQLADEGRLVIPIGTALGQELLTIERVAGQGYRETWGEACVFVPLVGRHGWDERHDT